MTDPATLAVGGVALGVALLAGWFHVPSPPELDGERWFKVILATLLRGAVEREGGDAASWERRVLRFVPFHPAGRLPERKVADPSSYRPPGLSVPGEQALVEALARHDDLAARWERLYGDETSIEARLGDPLELGAAYDPQRVLGPGGSWDDVADWGAGDALRFAEALQRHVHARWAVIEPAQDAPGIPRVLPALAALLGEAAVRVRVGEGEPEDEASTLEAWLAALLGSTADRLVVVAEGEAGHLALRALARSPSVRDRTLAVVLLGGRVVGTPELDDWMGRWFRAEALDTEVNRTTPYLHAAFFAADCAPPGVPGLPIAHTRLPPLEPGPLSRLRVVDLGVLPADPELPVEQVARALWAVTALEVAVARA